MDQDKEQNLNNAQSDKWAASFHGMEDVMFKVVAAVVPSAVAGLTELGGSENVTLFVPGDHVVYDELSFDFLVDEDLLNYQTLFDWIVTNTATDDPVYRDLSLHFLDTNGKFRGLRLEFTNAWPYVVTGFPLDIENATPDIVSNVSIKYERMRFVRSSIEIA